MTYSESREIIFNWWGRTLVSKDNPAARGNAARLRRAVSESDFLLEPCVHELVSLLDIESVDRAGLLAGTLACVREYEAMNLARKLGQKSNAGKPRMSILRFEKIIRSPNKDLTTYMRRAISMADRKCNVYTLGADLLFWGEHVRNRWCREYFGTPLKPKNTPEIENEKEKNS